MARVFGARFRPFDYAQMVAPVERADAMHMQLEEQMGELGAKASVWENLANQQSDPIAYAQYKSYADELANQANLLASNGLTPESRRGLINLKQRYSSDIVPIEQAYTRRQALVDEQRKALLQDNTLMFDRAASTLSLDDLMKNPALSPQAYSGATIARQVGTAAQSIAKEMRDNPRKWGSILGGQYFETRMKKGATPEEIILAAAGDPSAPKELRNIVEDVINSTGIREWGDQQALQRAYNYAGQGLWSAIGETTYQNLQNQEYLDPYKRSKLQGGEGPAAEQDLLPTIKLGIKGETKNSHLDKVADSIRLSGIGKVTTDEIEELTKQYDKAVKEKEQFELANKNDLNPIYTTFQGGYAQLGKAMRETQTKIPQLNTHEKKVREAYDKLQEARKLIDDLTTKYGYLSSNPAEAVKMGIKLEKNQNREYDQGRPLQGEGMPAVIDNIYQALTNIPEDQRDHENVWIHQIRADGSLKRVNSKDTKNLFESKDNKMKALFTTQNGFVLVDMKGNQYIVKGLQEIDKFNKQAKEANAFISDYSKAGVSNAIEYDTKKLLNLPERKLAEIIIEQQDRVGDNLYGMIIKDPQTGDIWKLVANTDGTVFRSELSSELYNDGISRARSLNRFFTGNARGLSNLYSGIKKESATLSNKISATSGD